MNDNIFPPKALQDQRSLATKCNKIGDETKHGHNNMITKYSFSFRVLTSKLTKLQIFCHIWIGPHSEFIYWKKLNKLSNNEDKLITTNSFVQTICRLSVNGVCQLTDFFVRPWFWVSSVAFYEQLKIGYGVYSCLSFFSFQNLILLVIWNCMLFAQLFEFCEWT